MDTPALVLASASPRRRRLIGWLGISVGTMAVDTPEDLSADLTPPDLATSLAIEKAFAARDAGETGRVLAFDTIVVLDGAVLGKPADEADARRMLRALSGGTHEVVTGVALLEPGATVAHAFPVTTLVTMRALSEADIDAWLAEGTALGCAGAYNIEHHLASVADDQCFQNVAGLPLCHVWRELAADGVLGGHPELVVPVAQCNAALGRNCLLGPLICRLGH